MKKSNIALRLGLTVLFIVLSVYYLYPTFHYSDLKKQQTSEISNLARTISVPQSDLIRAVVEGRDNDVMDMIDNSAALDDASKKVAEDKAHVLLGEFADKLDKNHAKALKLGLDLQGGMRLVLEVDLVQLMRQLAKNPDARFDTLLVELSRRLKDPNMDFDQAVLEVFEGAGVQMTRYFQETQASDRQVLAYLDKEADDAISRSLEIMRNRVDQFGVAEPSIVRQGKRRIVLELPGVQDPERARSLIGQTALLEFKLLVESATAQTVLENIDKTLRRAKGLNQDSLATVDSLAMLNKAATEADSTKQAPIAKDKIVDANKIFGEETEKGTLGEDTSLVVAEGMVSEHPFYALLRNIGDEIAVVKQNRRAVEVILAKPEIRKAIPSDLEFLWSNELIDGPDGKQYWNLFLVKSAPELTGKYLTSADVQIGSGGNSPGREGQPVVSLAMSRQGGQIFSRITGANVGRKLAIVLDKHVYMAPVIKVKIPDGRAIIEGSKDMDEAKDLSIVLRAGSLPAPVEIIEEQTVGPSLGSDSIQKGSLSGILSFILIAGFMIWYYKFAGLIADLALVLNMVFMIAVLAGFQATLTLPGIAGIILTIGMAVDANVLIYERIREELRTGKTVRAAIDAGYHRATITILDAQITTIISGIVLYQFGTGSIKGFALTLIIGIVVSLYTSIISSRLIFDMYTQKFAPKKLSI
ncbi:MAG: protein translocase subunit SecD [bacterium]|nr:protein translocase subunit SecD [bacterium]